LKSWGAMNQFLNTRQMKKQTGMLLTAAKATSAQVVGSV
jgi:hypothetical protein